MPANMRVFSHRGICSDEMPAVSQEFSLTSRNVGEMPAILQAFPQQGGYGGALYTDRTEHKCYIATILLILTLYRGNNCFYTIIQMVFSPKRLR